MTEPTAQELRDQAAALLKRSVALDNSNLSSTALAERRIAAALAVKVPVDSQGVPMGSPIVYVYDDEGRLISATAGKTD